MIYRENIQNIPSGKSCDGFVKVAILDMSLKQHPTIRTNRNNSALSGKALI